MRPLACSVIAVSALAVGTAAGALHAGSGTPMQAVTQTAGDRHDRQVLRVDNHHLRWQHNAQTLVLTSAAAGLLVTDASNTLPLQLRKGDHLRSANGQSIASVADLLRALRAAAGTPVTVEVVRAQAPLTLHWAASLYAPLLPPATAAPLATTIRTVARLGRTRDVPPIPWVCTHPAGCSALRPQPTCRQWHAATPAGAVCCDH